MSGQDPAWLIIARSQLGTKEIPGPRSNPSVEKYYLGVVGTRFSDAVPWCAAFVGWCLMEGKEHSSGSLMARSYLKYGKRCLPQPGAIAIFPRGNSKIFAHVNFVEHVVGDKLLCIGGNQSDAVTRAAFARNRALDFRWPL